MVANNAMKRGWCNERDEGQSTEVILSDSEATPRPLDPDVPPGSQRIIYFMGDNGDVCWETLSAVHQLTSVPPGPQ
jgi:hypothetical protein